jgi:hypothetical protein
VQPGGHEEIYIESMSPGNKGGHAAPQMTDSLAICDLFIQMDPALRALSPAEALKKILPWVKAASNQPDNTFESVVRDISALLGFSDSIPETNSREALYARINQIKHYLAGNGNLENAKQFTVVSLVGMSADSLRAAAESGPNALAYRYALRDQDPFVVLGVDYSARNRNGELDLYDPSTGHGTFTSTYLGDRSHYLVELLSRNVADSVAVPANSPHAYEKEYFYDYASGTGVFTPAATPAIGTTDQWGQFRLIFRRTQGLCSIAYI